MSSYNRTLDAKRQIDTVIRQFAPVRSNAHQPYWRLMTSVRASSRLLTSATLQSGDDDVDTIIRGCAQIAKSWRAWRQHPESWTAPDARAFVQFRDLVSHLFNEFPVPKFMAPVWWNSHDKPWQRKLYLHLAAGNSVRNFRLPLPYPVRVSKGMAQWFMQAPDDILPISAFRWAQVRSLGGDRRLANLLITCPALLIPTRHEEFWESVIRFLVANRPINSGEVNEIVRFIDQQRFQRAEIVWGPGAGTEPLQPAFSIKGRSLMSLRRQLATWRSDFAKKFPSLTPSSTCWEHTPIGAFRHSSGNTVWTIEELLTDRDLRVEGRMMQHCVANYSQRCARRTTSIWSMKVHEGQRCKRTLTIEVLPTSRTISQARGRRNAEPDATAERMLKQWAASEGLRFRGTP